MQGSSILIGGIRLRCSWMPDSLSLNRIFRFELGSAYRSRADWTSQGCRACSSAASSHERAFSCLSSSPYFPREPARRPCCVFCPPHLLRITMGSFRVVIWEFSTCLPAVINKSVLLLMAKVTPKMFNTVQWKLLSLVVPLAVLGILWRHFISGNFEFWNLKFGFGWKCIRNFASVMFLLRVSSSGIGRFVKKFKGPLKKKNLMDWVAQNWRWGLNPSQRSLKPCVIVTIGKSLKKSLYTADSASFVHM